LKLQTNQMHHNKNHKLKKFLTGALLAGFLLSSPQAFAAESSNIQDCPLDKRFDGFGQFLQSTISMGSFTEYFKDIFVRNMCHQVDIDALSNKLDKTRKQIRKAFYTCKTDKVSNLSKKYRELDVELSYLRFFVNYEDSKVTSNPNVYNELSAEYVDKKIWYNKEEFGPLYAAISGKYDMEKYAYCPGVVEEWEEKAEEWRELFSDAFSDFSKSIKDRWKKVNWSNDSKHAPPGKAGGGFLGRIGFFVNDVPPKYNDDEDTLKKLSKATGISQDHLDGIWKKIKEGDSTDHMYAIENDIPEEGIDMSQFEEEDNIEDLYEDKEKEEEPEPENVALDYRSLTNLMEQVDAMQANNIAIAKMIAQYSFLYKESSESSIDEFVRKLGDTYEDDKSDAPYGLQAILKSTTNPVLEDVKVCSTKIRDQQCK
jgi:hypothetical protein